MLHGMRSECNNDDGFVLMASMPVLRYRVATFKGSSLHPPACKQDATKTVATSLAWSCYLHWHGMVFTAWTQLRRSELGQHRGLAVSQHYHLFSHQLWVLS